MVSERVKVHLGLAAALVVLIVCMVLLIVGTLYRGDLRVAMEGSVAPDFALRDADNKPVELSSLRGDVVIVYFRGQTGDAPAPSTSPSAALATARSVPVVDSSVLSLTTVPAELNAKNATGENPDLSQLSAVYKEVNNPRLKVLELTNPASLESADVIGSLEPAAAGAVRTLIDPTGDVARKFRVDETDTKPTFFIIDPSGVIRYRGNSLQVGASAATTELAAPATEPSSSPQLVQTLLSSEAVNLDVPSSGHY